MTRNEFIAMTAARLLAEGVGGYKPGSTAVLSIELANVLEELNAAPWKDETEDKKQRRIE